MTVHCRGSHCRGWMRAFEFEVANRITRYGVRCGGGEGLRNAIDYVRYAFDVFSRRAERTVETAHKVV